MSDNLFFGDYKLNCFEITFNKYKVSTFYHNKAVKIPNGVTASICDSYDLDDNGKGKVNFSKIKSNTIPAYTPVWLESTEAKTYQFWYDETNKDKAPTPNYLFGTLKDIDIYNTFPTDKYNVFCLGLERTTGEVGWFAPSGPAPLPPYKAMIVIPKTSE